MPENTEIITNDLEIVLDTSPRALAKTDFQQAEEVADAIILETDKTKNPYHAFDSIHALNRISSIAGLAKAKVLYHLVTHWNDYGVSASFMTVARMNSNLTQVMIKRYISVWETIFTSDIVPEDVIEELKRKPINDLVPIMGALNLGYKIDEDTWDDIVSANSNQLISKIIRERVKKNEKESDAIFYTLDKSTGLMYAMNKGEKHVIGKLNLSAKDEVTQRAILRLVNHMNMEVEEE